MIRLRGLHLSTVTRLLQGGPQPTPSHVFIGIADHYEPMNGSTTPPRHVQDARVERWCKEYPELAAGIADSAGRPPQHTFFYPAEDFDLYRDVRERHIERLADLCRQGFGDVEVHLHHGLEKPDTPESLREVLVRFTEALRDGHGLCRGPDGATSYGFVHGNWALCNSRPDGKYCGVNEEIAILRETGCYADFTMPSAPAPAQTRTVNGIYYAFDASPRPRSHDFGTAARLGQRPPDGGLLMVQGPLMFDWSRRKALVLPRIENGDLTGSFVPTMSRFRLWLRAGVCVKGRPDWLFVKLHTHGAVERNADMLLGPPMRRFHEDLARTAAAEGFRYHYVTAREMARLVHQAESGRREPDLSVACEN